jgi:hypothetical protein
MPNRQALIDKLAAAVMFPMSVFSTFTGNPCNGCCPGMHDSAHNHPPPVLQFVLDTGGMCQSLGGSHCIISGFLIWDVELEVGYSVVPGPVCFPAPGRPCPQCASDPCPDFILYSATCRYVYCCGGSFDSTHTCVGGTLLICDYQSNDNLGNRTTTCDGMTVTCVQEQVPCATITYTCTDGGGAPPDHNSYTCKPSPSLVPYTCVDHRCMCTCSYRVAVFDDGTVITSAADLSSASGLILGANGIIGMECHAGRLIDTPDRWRCHNYSLTASDFVVSVARVDSVGHLDLSRLAPHDEACTTCMFNCQQCNPAPVDVDCSTCTPFGVGCDPKGSVAACDALYGANQWFDCRPYDPDLTCDNVCGVPPKPGCCVPVVFPQPMFALTVDCFNHGDEILGCSPCYYCDPERADCTETGDAGTEPSLWGNKKRPCKPCSYNDVSVFGVVKDRRNCPGATDCVTYPSCPDCATFGGCNPSFDITLYGPCGSKIHIFAP